MTENNLQHQLAKMQAKISALETKNQELHHVIQSQKNMAALFSTVTKNMLDMVALTDIEGNFIFAGKAHETLGYDPDFLAGKNVMDFVHPQDLPYVMEKFNQSIDKGNSGKVEYRYRCKNGSYLWFETTGKVLDDDSGSPKKIIFNSRDVTERHKIENALRKSEERYKQLFNNVPDIIYSIDDNGDIITTNQSAFEKSGYKAEEFQGKPFIDFIHPEDRDTLLNSFLNAIKEKRAKTNGLRFRILKKNHSCFWVELNANARFDSHGRYMGEEGILHDITLQKQAEDALRESETRFKALHNASFGGIAIHDKGRILECNQGLSEITGYSTDELIGMDGLLLISEKTRDMVLNHILSGYEKPYEAIGVRKNGDEYRLRLDARNIPYKGKNVRVTEFRDITESKKAEKALRESETKYRMLFQNVSEGILIARGEKVDLANPAMLKIMEYPLEIFTSKSFTEFIHPDDRETVLERHLKRLRGEPVKTNYPFRIVAGNGTEKWVQIHSNIIEWNGEPASLSLVSDISERKRREIERERLMAAIAHTEEVIVITDPEGTIQYVNPAFEKITGYTQAEAIGQNPRILASGHQNELFYKELWDTIASGNIWTGRMVNKKKDGSLYTEDATISPVYNPEGKIINYVATKKDVTEHLRVQEQLQQAQKMESVGRLAGGVAHDFNNLLSVILGFTEMAMDKVDPDSLLYDDLSEVLNAANRSTGIVQQLLAFARKQIISPKILNLNDTVTDMVKMLRRLIGEDIDLIWKPSKDVWPVKMDPSQTDQILANLCVNARDAISDIGKITIETQNTVIDEQYCKKHRYFVPGEYVMLTVSDTGSGMDQEIADKIFEPFFTTKEAGKGTGLGLSTVYGIMKQNNGFINCKSNPGQGTTFAIFLPRHWDKAEQLIEEKASKTPKPENETILLVEDEQAILKMTARMLEKLGYIVIKAHTPGDAIHLAKKHNGEIHLLMTDIVMPEMNGRDLAKNILSIYPNISRLFMSGYTSDVIARHGVLEAGVHFIHKPFSVTNLAPKIQEALDKENGQF